MSGSLFFDRLALSQYPVSRRSYSAEMAGSLAGGLGLLVLVWSFLLLES